LVNIPKRPPPPPLPPRNNARASRVLMVDQASGQSPMKSEFEEVDLHGVGRRSEDSRKSRLSEEQEKAVVQDTKKAEVAEIPAVDKLDENTEQAKKADKEEHVEKVEHTIEITPTVGRTEGDVKHESEDIKANGLLAQKHETEDADTFHSVPTSPMEIVQVK